MKNVNKKVLYISNSVDKKGKGGDYIYSHQLFDAVSGLSSSNVDLIKLNPNVPVSSLSILKKIYLFLFSLFFPFMWREAINIFMYNRKNTKNYPYDIVIIDHFRCAWYYVILKIHGYKGEIFLIQHNVESKIALESFYNTKNILKVAYLYEYIKLFLFEILLFKLINKISCISESDFEYCLKIKRNNCFLIKPAFEQEFLVTESGHQLNRNALIIGSFHWAVKRDNLLRLLNSFKEMDREIPKGFNIIIAGSMPRDFQDTLLLNFNFIKVINNFGSLHDLINIAAVAIAPDDVGGGFKLKLLDYLSLGLPIYGIKGAMSGFEEVIPSVKSYTSFLDLGQSLFVDITNEDYIREVSETIMALRSTAFSKEKLRCSMLKLLE